MTLPCSTCDRTAPRVAAPGRPRAVERRDRRQLEPLPQQPAAVPAPVSTRDEGETTEHQQRHPAAGPKARVTVWPQSTTSRDHHQRRMSRRLGEAARAPRPTTADGGADALVDHPAPAGWSGRGRPRPPRSAAPRSSSCRTSSSSSSAATITASPSPRTRCDTADARIPSSSASSAWVRPRRIPRSTAPTAPRQANHAGPDSISAALTGPGSGPRSRPRRDGTPYAGTRWPACAASA